MKTAMICAICLVFLVVLALKQVRENPGILALEAADQQALSAPPH
jgi:hypothetical protein